MTTRIQRKRTRGWRMPDGVVYVGRPTKWGNPFRGTDAVPLYEEHVSKMPAEVVAELRGKDLACWCALDAPCHADVLMRLANGKAETALQERR